MKTTTMTTITAGNVILTKDILQYHWDKNLGGYMLILTNEGITITDREDGEIQFDPSFDRDELTRKIRQSVRCNWEDAKFYASYYTRNI
jgi:hypothetical protein